MYNLKAWFTNPVDNQVEVYKKAARALELEIQHRLRVQAALLAAQPETSQVLAGGRGDTGSIGRFRQRAGAGVGRYPRRFGDTACHLGTVPGARAGRTYRSGARALAKRLHRTGGADPAGRRPATDGNQEIQRRLGANRRQPQGLPHAVHHADGADHAVRALHRDLAGAYPGQPDQHADHGDSGGRRRGAARQPAAPGDGARRGRTRAAGHAASTR